MCPSVVPRFLGSVPRSLAFCATVQHHPKGEPKRNPFFESALGSLQGRGWPKASEPHLKGNSFMYLTYSLQITIYRKAFFHLSRPLCAPENPLMFSAEVPLHSRIPAVASLLTSENADFFSFPLVGTLRVYGKPSLETFCKNVSLPSFG